ncbi:MAG TPA: M28 family peptidase [Solirubrobacteraceae bacterium]|nr:M28 family peptidase [Solirubrobacteraceae bacterium]
MIDASIRSAVDELAALERGSATDGEARAAALLVEMFAERGLAAEIEHEQAVGDYWRTSGFAAAAAAGAGLLARRSRLAATALAGSAAAVIADDVDCGGHAFRRLLPKRTAANVLAWAGDPAATRTIVLAAHHDAARTGLLFHPGLVPAVARAAPGFYARQTTSTQTGKLLVTGPLLVAVGSALGLRRLRRFGVFWSAVTAALLADVARSPLVPGANDNLSSVAVLLALARGFAERPPAGVRVLLLSTGSEESFMEGMRGFVARHRAELDPAQTTFVALECLGSPHLAILEGEGMLRMRDYDAALRDELQAAADAAGEPVWRGLRLGAGASDALPALKAGYRAACLAAVTDLKTPANYHWPSDVPANLSWETIDAAARLVDGLVRGAAGAAQDVSAAAISSNART